jgi:hypothetical protein
MFTRTWHTHIFTVDQPRVRQCPPLLPRCGAACILASDIFLYAYLVYTDISIYTRIAYVDKPLRFLLAVAPAGVRAGGEDSEDGGGGSERGNCEPAALFGHNGAVIAPTAGMLMCANIRVSDICMHACLTQLVFDLMAPSLMAPSSLYNVCNIHAYVRSGLV